MQFRKPVSAVKIQDTGFGSIENIFNKLGLQRVVDIVIGFVKQYPQILFSQLIAVILLVSRVISVSFLILFTIKPPEKLVDLFGFGVEPALVLHLVCDLRFRGRQIQGEHQRQGPWLKKPHLKKMKEAIGMAS
jgi:hypothetical protein